MADSTTDERAVAHAPGPSAAAPVSAELSSLEEAEAVVAVVLLLPPLLLLGALILLCCGDAGGSGGGGEKEKKGECQISSTDTQTVPSSPPKQCPHPQAS